MRTPKLFMAELFFSFSICSIWSLQICHSLIKLHTQQTSTALVLISLDTSLHDLMCYPMEMFTNNNIKTLIGNIGEPDFEHEVAIKESEPENAEPSPMNQEPRPSTSHEPIDDGFFGGRSSRLDSHPDLHVDQGTVSAFPRNATELDQCTMPEI